MMNYVSIMEGGEAKLKSRPLIDGISGYNDDYDDSGKQSDTKHFLHSPT